MTSFRDDSIASLSSSNVAYVSQTGIRFDLKNFHTQILTQVLKTFTLNSIFRAQRGGCNQRENGSK